MGNPVRTTSPVHYTMKSMTIVLLIPLITVGFARFDDDDINGALACTAGSNVGDKLVEALENCAPEPNTRMTKLHELMRDDCPTYKEIKQWVKSQYADDACVMQSIGWMNRRFNFINATITADLMELAPMVVSHLDDDSFKTCAPRIRSSRKMRLAAA